VVARGDGALVDLVAVCWVLDLYSTFHVSNAFQFVSISNRTQKSMSKLLAPPNSRSPTWKVTVILSSACNCSWKHSRECAFSRILCAAERPARASRPAIDGSLIVVVSCDVAAAVRSGHL
jgi:hypothetical protein